MRELSRRTVNNPYEDGWPNSDPEWLSVSISLTDRLLQIIDEKVNDSSCEHDNRSALVRDALYDWLEMDQTQRG
jgi:hypothetical protein